MFLGAFFNGTALLVFLGALALSILLYLKNIREKIVPAANLCLLLVFLCSIVFVIQLLSEGLEDPSYLTNMLSATLLMDLYAGVCNVLARILARVLELMGNKRLKIRIQAEVVER
jgi:MFS superfamily sulfate permease-like transporter